MAVWNSHRCRPDEKGYCRTRAISIKVIEAAQIALKELEDDTVSGARKRLLGTGQAKLVCKACGHKGMLSKPIFGRPPNCKIAHYAANAEEDFAICPQCAHWAVIENPHAVRAGAVV
ncbi:hypothetical protein HZB94_00840 [Candidatus Falkowbacteria bacterium]|nr:hypothetical protein [Candidatus Falkowbacteria bacterium]